ncbi:mitochondrial protein [Laetiporus sulphureus 93-53]|uniref:trimethyllysine dioxygenase n=1 Tax=Laetiporus sulphureus 93-53 TaxID=1314785 RepID=A0A165E0W2_9APHY|nr:mitochondrial protein [Laetiporus sulphureus 93-53]KZT06032.1 mitochondrial protein [Laetiporus sulphureus 93-53]
MWRSAPCLRASTSKTGARCAMRRGTGLCKSFSRVAVEKNGLVQVHRTFVTTPSRWSSTAAVLKQAADTSSSTNAPVSADLPVSRIDDRQVLVGWDVATWSRYHHIWLRDHCRCSQCFHPITKQRLMNTFEIPPDVKPLHVESKPDGLEVQWPSSKPHTSFFPWSWLRQNSYDPQLIRASTTEKILWGSKILQDPPTVAYEEVMAEDEKGLFKWLSNIDKFGFCFVTGVPPTPEATEELSCRIGFIRETQYGKFWSFTSDLTKGDTAYTTLALGAHTDNTYFTDPCGLQLFHLLSHTDGSGGATLLVDGFYVASILKELHPTAYSLLSRIRVPAHAAGELGSLYTPSPSAGYPVLRHVDGELIEVRWNNDDRSVMNHLEPSEVEEWYDSIRKWYKLLTSADSEYWVQLSPGTAVVVDNHRVLHGRSVFDGKRRMCGAYIGIDEYRSKLAVLSEKFTPDTITRETMSYAGVNGRSVWHPAL